jgi:recombination associated protein RdgC
MWLKNATIFGISPKAQFPVEQLEAARFVPAGDLQLTSSGFVPIQGELAYKQGKHTLLRFMMEKKHLPGSAVAVKLEERCAELEDQQGFRPGKKAMKELKEQVIDELLPRALSSRRSTLVWIDQDQHRIVIDSTSNAVIDEVLRVLRKTYEGIDLGICDVSWPRAKVLTEWAIDNEPADFTVDDTAVLAYPGERGKVVKFERADLSQKDVQQHFAAGAIVQSVAMTFGSRLSFVMTDNNQIRKIKPLDVLQEGRDAEKDVDRFAGDVELMTRELGVLFDRLVREA